MRRNWPTPPTGERLSTLRETMPAEPAEPAPPELSIARALDPLPPADEAALCAFVATSEKELQSGYYEGWRITRYAGKSVLEVSTADYGIISGEASTIREACTELSKALIAEGMKGAPSA